MRMPNYRDLAMPGVRPNFWKPLLFFFFLFFSTHFVNAQCLNGNYSIGGTGADYDSISHAVAALDTYGVCGPVKFSITSGNYNEQVTIPAIKGVSKTNQIVFDGGDTSKVYLSHDGKKKYATLLFKGADWVTFTNMTIQTIASTDGFVVQLMDTSDHITIDKNRILMSNSGTSDLTGVLASGSETNDYTEGDNAKYLVISNNTISGGEFGIQLEGNGTSLSKSIVIKNNIIENVYYDGIETDNHDSLIISGNTIRNIRNSSGNGLDITDADNVEVIGNNIIVPDYGIEMDDININGFGRLSIIADNYVEATGDDGMNLTDIDAVHILRNTIIADDYGIYIYDLNATTTDSSVIANNMITAAGDGLYVYNPSKTDIFHNSIHAPVGVDLGNFTGMDIRNNIFYGSSSYAFDSDADTGFVTLDYNIYYTGGADLVTFNGTLYQDLSAWTTAYGSLNANSLEGDPNFNGTTDLHVSGFFANDKGDNKAGITTDIDGQSRPAISGGTVDIGADEFIIPANDAQVESIENPTTMCGLSSTENVKIIVKNLGTDSIGSLTAGYILNNGSVVNETFTIKKPQLGSADTIHLVFTNTLDLSSPGWYDITVWTELAGDTSNLNDTLTKRFSNPVFYSPFTETFDTVNLLSETFFRNVTSDDIDWEINSGTTGSGSTGPSGDHTTGSGNYIYLEASSPNSPSKTAILERSCPETDSFNFMVLEFWYHMYGSDMGDLYVDIDTNGSWVNIFSLSGEQQTAESDAWKKATIPLGMYSNINSIRFRGITGSGYRSDLSIDDIGFIDLKDLDASISDVLSPLSPCVGSNAVEFEVTNRGADTLKSLDINVELNGSLEINKTVAVSIPPLSSTIINAGNINFSTGSNQELKVYSSSPNGSTDENLANDTFTVQYPTLALTGTFTIGSSGADYSTFAAAVADLSTSGVCGPVIFKVANGTYSEQVTINSINGVSATNTVTFDGGDSSLTILSHDGTSQYATLLINGADYLVVKNMTIRTTASTDGFGVQLLNASNHVTLSNNRIEMSTSGTVDLTGVLTSADPTDDFTEGDNANYLTIRNNVINGGEYSIQLEGDGTSGNRVTIIDGNLLDSSYDAGIETDNHDSLIITNNTISNIRYSFGDGMNILDASNMVISGNRILSSPDYGIQLDDINENYGGTFSTVSGNYIESADDGINADDIEQINIEGNRIMSSDYGMYITDVNLGMTNNISITNNMIIAGNDGIYMDDIINLNFYHNSISAPTAVDMSGFQNADIRNNIFVGSSSVAFDADSDTGITNLDYNLYYTSGSNIASYSGSTYSSLANWQASASSVNKNSVEMKPKFESGNDLHLKGPLTNDLGDNTVGVSVDIDNETRPAISGGKVDVGADEYTPPVNDLGIVSVVFPGEKCGSTNSEVGVVVENLGTNSQSLTPVRINITGPQKMSFGAFFSGLASGEIDTFYFSNTFNTLKGGTYSFTAIAQLTGDQDAENDTLEASKTYFEVPAVPSINDQVICGPGSVDLIGAPGKEISLLWYDSMTGGKLIKTGDTLTTGTLNTTTTFYAATASRHPGGLMISEVELGGTDFIEIHNTSADTVDATGWKVVASASYSSINSINGDFWEPGKVAPGEVLYRTDNSSDNYWGSNLLFDNGSNGWVMILDDLNNIVDIVFFGWKASGIAGFNPTVDGASITLGNAWSGDGATSCSSGSSVQRISFDDNMDSDFSCGTASKGSLNKGISASLLCESSRSPVTVTVNPLPDPMINLMGRSVRLGTPDTLCTGDTAIYELIPPTGFTNADLGTKWMVTNLKFETKFGNAPADTVTIPPVGGNNSMLVLIGRSADADSLYTLSLTVENMLTGCRETITRSLFVVPSPSASFTVSDICAGDTAILSNTSGISNGTLSYRWELPNGVISNSKDELLSIVTPGTYDITLKVRSNYGCTAETTQTITVYPKPEPDFMAMDVCNGDTVNFVNMSSISSGNIVSYSWNFGDDSVSTLENPQHFYSSAGTYTVTLTVMSDNGCPMSVTKTINVFDESVADFGFVNACKGSAVNFSDSSKVTGGTLTYRWEFGDGNTSVSQNPSHIYASSGTFDVTLIVTSDKGCQDMITRQVEVYPTPAPEFTAGPVCIGDTTEFTVTNGAGPNATYSWDFGDDSSSVEMNPSHVYSEPGVYFVTLTAVTVQGCEASVMRQVRVYPQPDVSFFAREVCFGNETEFINTTAIAGSATMEYMWDFGDGNTDTVENPNHTYSAAGTYTVTLTAVSASGCANSISDTINVMETPDAAFTFTEDQGTVKFVPADTTYNFYLWQFGDGSVSLDHSPEHTYTSNGEYIVNLSVRNDRCSAVSIDTVSIQSIGINDVLGTANINLGAYPNPFKGQAFIEYNLPSNAAVVLSVYDAQGRKVSQLVDNVQEAGSYKYEFNTREFSGASGLYLIRLLVDGHLIEKRIIETK